MARPNAKRSCCDARSIVRHPKRTSVGGLGLSQPLTAPHGELIVDRVILSVSEKRAVPLGRLRRDHELLLADSARSAFPNFSDERVTISR